MFNEYILQLKIRFINSRLHFQFKYFLLYVTWYHTSYIYWEKCKIQDIFFIYFTWLIIFLTCFNKILIIKVTETIKSFPCTYFNVYIIVVFLSKNLHAQVFTLGYPVQSSDRFNYSFNHEIVTAIRSFCVCSRILKMIEILQTLTCISDSFFYFFNLKRFPYINIFFLGYTVTWWNNFQDNSNKELATVKSDISFHRYFLSSIMWKYQNVNRVWPFEYFLEFSIFNIILLTYMVPKLLWYFNLLFPLIYKHFQISIPN